MKVVNARVTRALEVLGIAYRILPHGEAVYTVEAAARERGVPAEEMVKCILLVDAGRRYVMACLPGNARVDVRAVREALPEYQRLRFASADEIAQVTGYVQGAVAPVDLPETVPVIVDPAVTRCARVKISSGDPLAGLELDAQDLVRAARGRTWPIAERR